MMWLAKDYRKRLQQVILETCEVRDYEDTIASTRGRVRPPQTLSASPFSRILAKHAENGIADITRVAGWYLVRAIAD
jgi:hypothetical protein